MCSGKWRSSKSTVAITVSSVRICTGSLLADMEFVLPLPFTLPEIAAHYEQISEGMKRCGVCVKVLPVHSFPWLIHGKWRYYCCLPCRRSKYRQAYRERLDGAITEGRKE